MMSAVQSEENQFLYEEAFQDCGEITIVKADLSHLSDDFETGTYPSIIHDGKETNILL